MQLLVDERMVGMASYEGNHITRVFVAPEDQNRGYGSYMMKRLEEKIAKEYNAVRLESSLPSVRMYEQRGYRTVSHEKWPVKNGAVMTYEIMEKTLIGIDIQE